MRHCSREEQGKPLREAVLEIRRYAHTIEYYAGLGKNIRGGYIPQIDEGKYGMIIKRPLGVCGAIVPWNFPVSLMGNKIGPALLAGNTMVIKPAETTPLTDLRVVGSVRRSGSAEGRAERRDGAGLGRRRRDRHATRRSERSASQARPKSAAG